MNNSKEGVAARVSAGQRKVTATGPKATTPTTTPLGVSAMELGDTPSFGFTSPAVAAASSAPTLPPIWGEEVKARVTRLAGADKKPDEDQSGVSNNAIGYGKRNTLSIYSVNSYSFMILIYLSLRKGDATPHAQGQKRALSISPGSADAQNKRKKDEDFSLFFHYKQQERGPRITVHDIAHAEAHFRIEIDKLKGSLVVKMRGISIKRGYGLIQCDDQETFTWASGIVNAMGNGSYRTCEKNEVFYSTHTVGMWVRERNDPDPAFLFPAISVQNNGFDTSKWRLVSAQPTKGGQFLLVEMDDGSFGAIQPPAKLYYYMDRLNFKFNPTKKKPQRK